MAKRASVVVLFAATLLGLAAIDPPRDAVAQLIGKPAPEITNDTWLHSKPLRLEDLRGRVVLLEFWTYG